MQGLMSLMSVSAWCHCFTQRPVENCTGEAEKCHDRIILQVQQRALSFLETVETSSAKTESKIHIVAHCEVIWSQWLLITMRFFKLLKGRMICVSFVESQTCDQPWRDGKVCKQLMLEKHDFRKILCSPALVLCSVRKQVKQQADWCSRLYVSVFVSSVVPKLQANGQVTSRWWLDFGCWSLKVMVPNFYAIPFSPLWINTDCRRRSH